jgi:hypothetical protein
VARRVWILGAKCWTKCVHLWQRQAPTSPKPQNPLHLKF